MGSVVVGLRFSVLVVALGAEGSVVAVLAVGWVGVRGPLFVGGLPRLRAGHVFGGLSVCLRLLSLVASRMPVAV